MNKKISYVIGLVVVIILGVLFARVLSGSIAERPASSSKVKNSNKLTTNQVKNETNNNTKKTKTKIWSEIIYENSWRISRRSSYRCRKWSLFFDIGIKF